jgi:hypothetical protein
MPRTGEACAAPYAERPPDTSSATQRETFSSNDTTRPPRPKAWASSIKDDDPADDELRLGGKAGLPRNARPLGPVAALELLARPAPAGVVPADVARFVLHNLMLNGALRNGRRPAGEATGGRNHVRAR